MENVINFATQYIWVFVAISVLLLFAFLGYIVEKISRRDVSIKTKSTEATTTQDSEE